MAIQSVSEFEAVLTHVISRIEKAVGERGSVPVLETAHRDLQHIFQAARKPGKLKPLRGLLEQVTDVLTAEIPNDNVLLEQLWDLGDYIDYRG
jgi:hypothetical protein